MKERELKKVYTDYDVKESSFLSNVIKNILKPYFLSLYHCDNVGRKVEEGNKMAPKRGAREESES